MSEDPPQTNVSNDLIREYARKLGMATRACNEANAVRRNILKQAKGDGVNTKSLLKAERARKLEPEEVVAEVRDDVRYMTLAGIEGLSREGLFGPWEPTVTSKTRMEDQLWEAGDAGYHAGRYGMDVADCPYDHGSELAAAWMRSWQDGQAAIAAEMPTDTELPDATRARPERLIESDDDSDEEERPANTKGTKRGRPRAALPAPPGVAGAPPN